ncbi:MAG: ferritin-like domain-containing protein, partial [Longimicrobiales bacterium]
LTLEYLEAEFYTIGVNSGVIPGADRQTFITIRNHEIAHVQFLLDVLGGAAVAKPAFDFTAGGMFAPFSDYAQFQLLAQAFEDTGVRAYKGQLGALQPYKTFLSAGASIHSVEARHASQVRRMRGLDGWIPFNGSDSPAAVAAVYAGEGATTQAGVDLTGLNLGAFNVSPEDITESFDEPLDMQAVLAIAAPFIA